MRAGQWGPRKGPGPGGSAGRCGTVRGAVAQGQAGVCGGEGLGAAPRRWRGGLCPWARRPLPAAPPALGLQREAHRYLNFDFILFYFISLLPRAGAVPPGTAAPRPPPRASLYYCNKCAYKGAGSGARVGGAAGAAERGCNFPKPEPEGEWAGWRGRGGRASWGDTRRFPALQAARAPLPPTACALQRPFLSWSPSR